MFITTANLADPIPSALRDRMEIIEISGYTDDEKMHIARSYIWPRQLGDHGLTGGQLAIADRSLLSIINEYTEEAGLRNLEKELGAICRKIARKVAEGKKGPFRITPKSLHRYLGPPVFLPDELRKNHETGVATGLAWTPSGGEVLTVETTVMKGKGNFQLTGQLGEVMKESAQAALSYARSRSRLLHLKESLFDSLDIHIHVPAGAIPKDGPSAGITLAVSLISALTGIPVNKDVAMTGEITLRGRILPVGGLKEKTLAAIRSKLKTLIIPEQNRKDLAEIPRAIRRRLQIILVRDMDQVIDRALISKPTAKKKAAPPQEVPVVRIAYLDCFSGISGDMVLGAWLDLGLPAPLLRGVFKNPRSAALSPSDPSGGTGRVVRLSGHGPGREESPAHRSYRQLRKLIAESSLAPEIKAPSLEVLRHLAVVEGHIHGREIEDVHFHEIGALDTVIDAVGAALGFHYFQVNSVWASPLPVGLGWVQSQHGPLPLPAPATLALLKGAALVPSAGEQELITPTGAAIVTTWVQHFGPPPACTLSQVGYGLGHRELPDRPNALRIWLGEESTPGNRKG